MLIGLLSDAHGNFHGFSACASRLAQEGVERIFYLGDAVGYMPDVAPILGRLGRMNAICLRGNHEEMLLGTLPLSPHRDRVYRLSEARRALDATQHAFICGWHGPSLEVTESGRRLAFFHGSPWAPADGYVYPDADLSRFAGLPYDCVFMGHTHRPFQARAGDVQVVNVGSCGLPRDRGNLAGCAVYDTESRAARILRVPFDAERVIADYGERMHLAVAECLRRTGPDPAQAADTGA